MDAPSKRLCIKYVPISSLRNAEYNPRKHDEAQLVQMQESIKRFGLVDPLIINEAPGRENIVVGGNFRLETVTSLGYTEVPVVTVNIPDLDKEKELNIRLNKNGGGFDLELLAEFDESFLKDVGFDTEELDDVFPTEEDPEKFDIEKELDKLGIGEIETKTGDVYDLDGSRLMCGNSMVEADVLKLMNGEKTDMVMTDPPYLLDYLKGKKKKDGEVTEGFGLKRDRVYIGTTELPDNFTELWMANIAKIQKENFSIIVYENWKNIRTIWNEMEKYWKVRNMIVWHLPNRNQGYAGKYKFFSKYDIAMVGSSKGDLKLDISPEPEELLQEQYETALYATTGTPQWEGYEHGKKIQPTDFIEFKASDQKSSGQGIIFGTKPTDILIPYIKVLTKRGDLVVEPFGGSGSTLIACEKLKRRCFIMEKQPIYAAVIINRWEKLTGKKAIKING